MYFMLTKAQEKLIRSLHTKKGRATSGRCLVEGEKCVSVAGDFVDFTFSKHDSESFEKLVTTETPSDIAAVARIPSWGWDRVRSTRTIVVLDGVQDPGNVGSILRLCLGFDAALILIESADVTSPKVIRSSVGALFQVPWQIVPRSDAIERIHSLNRPIIRLELRGERVTKFTRDPVVIIAGSEGNGITLDIMGTSVAIPHNPALESLNVTHALAIILSQRFFG